MTEAMRKREGAGLSPPAMSSLACDPGTPPVISEPPCPHMPNGARYRFLGWHENLIGSPIEMSHTRPGTHSSHSPNINSFAFAENSSWIVCKPLRCTGQNCSQGELLNDAVYLYSGKIEIIMLWLAGAIYRPCSQWAFEIRDLPNKFTSSPTWP